MTAKWIHLGIAHVDAGMLMVGDPCYATYESHPEHPVHNWDKLCESLDTPAHSNGMQLNHPAGHAGLGVIVCTGGDGEYDVDARFTQHGDLAEIRIRPSRA